MTPLSQLFLPLHIFHFFSSVHCSFKLFTIWYHCYLIHSYYHSDSVPNNLSGLRNDFRASNFSKNFLGNLDFLPSSCMMCMHIHAHHTSMLLLHHAFADISSMYKTLPKPQRKSLISLWWIISAAVWPDPGQGFGLLSFGLYISCLLKVPISHDTSKLMKR